MFRKCHALGCQVNTERFFCTPHLRLLSVKEKTALQDARYRGQPAIDAIERIAEREKKEINNSQYLKLQKELL